MHIKALSIGISLSVCVGLTTPPAWAEETSEAPSIRFVKTTPGFLGIGAQDLVLEADRPEVTPLGQLVGGPLSGERWTLLGPPTTDWGGLRARMGWAGQSHVQAELARLLSGHADASRELALAEAAALDEDRYLLSSSLIGLAAGFSLGMAMGNTRQSEGYYAQYTVLFTLINLVPAYMASQANARSRMHLGRAVRTWNWALEAHSEGEANHEN